MIVNPAAKGPGPGLMLIPRAFQASNATAISMTKMSNQTGSGVGTPDAARRRPG